MREASATILVVDDKEINRYLVAKHLQKAGFNVVLGRNGAEGMDQAKALSPDLIILDVNLPDMSGYEVCRRLKASSATAQIPIVHLSAHYDSTEGVEALSSSPADGYLTQPINPMVLKATVQSFLRLRKAEKQLEDAVRARDSFLSIASHELKTPLTSLKMQAELRQRRLQKREFAQFSEEKVSAMIEHDERQIERLIRLVDDMLDVSRIHSGKLAIVSEPFDLCQLTQELYERYKPQFETAGCTVFLSCDESVVGKWDRFRIEQVLINLFTNAIKYGAGKPVEIKVGTERGNAVVSVQDRGRGIAQADQERIFGQFERAVGTNGVSGLGLGLFIVRQILEGHGGSVRVESELGRGARFVVELPLTV